MPMITIKDLTFGYDGSDKLLFDGVSVTIDSCWKLALAGRNGRGKTTFFKLLKGELDHGGTSFRWKNSLILKSGKYARN